MYWVPFEQYVASLPELQRNYKAQELTKFAGTETYVRARCGKSDDATKKGSDLEHVEALIWAKGYTASGDDECAASETAGSGTTQRADDYLLGYHGA